jgi:uncharacterized protein YwgA
MTHGTAKDVRIIVGVAGELVGRTRLQKTASLLEMVGLGFGFSFDYYKYGPYSDDLVISLERAVDLGYVTEEERRANWGGRYSIFRTTEQISTDSPARDALINIAKGADAVALELAVTAAFLARSGSADAWADVATRKPEKIGGNHLANAKSLYAQLRQVADVPRPLPAIV